MMIKILMIKIKMNSAVNLQIKSVYIAFQQKNKKKRTETIFHKFANCTFAYKESAKIWV